MSELQFVPKNQYKYADVTEGVVPAGSIPIGGGDDFQTAVEKRSVEAFMPGVERRVSWGDSDVRPSNSGTTPKKRGPGRPRKTAVVEDKVSE